MTGVYFIVGVVVVVVVVVVIVIVIVIVGMLLYCDIFRLLHARPSGAVVRRRLEPRESWARSSPRLKLNRVVATENFAGRNRVNV
jgi:type IV secretory pathway VirB3-like protein